MLRKFFFLVSVFLLLIYNIAEAQTNGYQYHPLNCDPQNRFFVSLGGTVLAIPDSPVTAAGVSPFGDGPKPFKPSDETQPAGCYGNPIPSTGLRSMDTVFAPQATLWRRQNANYPASEIRLRSLDISRPGGMEDSMLYLNHDVCQHKIRETNNDGVQTCQRTATVPENSEMSFKISQERFPTFTKKDFSFTCPATANLAGLGRCQTSLVIARDIQINLQFYVPAQGYGSDFPEKVMAFVLSIKSGIDAAMQNGYPWEKNN